VLGLDSCECARRYFMVGGAESGTVGSQRGAAAAAGRHVAAAECVFGPGVIGELFSGTTGDH
jgi:hypothetical protein